MSGKTAKAPKPKRGKLRRESTNNLPSSVKREAKFRRWHSEEMLAASPDTVAYYYGCISRENAELILHDRGCLDGMYLLRASNNSDADYVISLCNSKQIQHYRIRKTNDGMYFLCGAPDERYRGPVELVENIRVLPCKQMIPCIKPLNIFMPGVNCGITDGKLKDAMMKKAKEWGLQDEQLRTVLEDTNNDLWKVIMKTLHELEEWFHGRINRREAERRLFQSGMKDGKFLIRERDDCSFTLSICFTGVVKHYKIDVLPNGDVGIQDGPRFDNLISLVSHYSVFSDGLWCCLDHACVNSNNNHGEVQIEAGNSRGISWPIQRNGTDFNPEHIQPPVSPLDFISPIATHRSGSTSSVTGNGENSASKSSSKSKGSEISVKNGSTKIGIRILKNPGAFLGIFGPDSKSTVNLSKFTPLKDEEKKVPAQRSLPSDDLQAKSIAPPTVAKKVLLPSPTILPKIPEVPLAVVTPNAQVKIPLRPPPLRGKDTNGKFDSPVCNHDSSPSSPLTTTPSSPLEDVIDTFVAVVIKDTVPSAALSPDSVPPLPPSVTKSKPLVAPRRKSPQSNVDLIVNQSESVRELVKSAETSPDLVSPTRATRFCLDVTTINCYSGTVPDSTTNVRTGENSPTGPMPPKRPNVWLPTNDATKNLTSVIDELKNRVMSAVGNDLKSLSSEPSAALDATAVIDASESTKPEAADLRNASTTDSSVVLREQSTRNQQEEKSSPETNSTVDPQYVEIDPDYEKNKDSTGSTVNNDAGSNVTNEIPEVTTESLVNATVEESKWDDASEEATVATPLSTSTTRSGLRKPPWTKEQSEFHFKTIKRHRKGLVAIDRKLLCFQEKLGSGNFGEVLKATFKSGNDEVPCALKTLRQDHFASSKGEILTEARIMTKLDHAHIVRLLGISEGDPFLLVMELAPLGPLRTYLKKNPKVPISDVIGLMHQVALGMEYLESKQFVHRDLAARNVLLVNENFAKISDFGMSKALGLHSDYYTVEPKGKLPLKWYAPECIYYFKFSTKSDVWSYGVTLWEALSYGLKPYMGLTGREILKMFSTNKRLSCPTKCPKEIYLIMMHCWEFKPEDRPTFSQLVEKLKYYSDI